MPYALVEFDRWYCEENWAEALSSLLLNSLEHMENASEIDTS